jgi:hypothetical protein
MKPNLSKLLLQLELLISALEEHKCIVVHSKINQFYYMEKVVELRTLSDRAAEIQLQLEQINSVFESTYSEVFCRWRKDARWLNFHFNFASDKES